MLLVPMEHCGKLNRLNDIFQTGTVKKKKRDEKGLMLYMLNQIFVLYII